MTLSRWDPVLEAIAVFRSYLAPNVPPFELIAPVDRRWTDEEYGRRRPRGFPCRLRGVYLIYDDAEVLLYIGLATDCFDKRVWSHDSRLPRHYTDIIVFGEEHLFLAPALEYFLITRLRPTKNTTFRGHECTIVKI
jgi:hypothetical protein